MRLLILTYGTEGDTRPLAALGHALVQAGHSVHLLADVSTLDTAQAMGLPCSALAGDIRATLAAEGAMKRITANLSRLAIGHTGDWMRQALEAGRGCDAVIVSGLTAFVGLSVAEALGVPAIGTMLIPISPRTAFASPFLPFTPPRLFNRASHMLFGQASWRRGDRGQLPVHLGVVADHAAAEVGGDGTRRDDIGGDPALAELLGHVHGRSASPPRPWPRRRRRSPDRRSGSGRWRN